MPELPEVETTRRSLEPLVVGQRLEAVALQRADLRAPIPAEALQRWTVRRHITAVRRRAKYLLLDFSGGGVLMVHLGMSGRLHWSAQDAPLRKHDHICWRFAIGRELRLEDPRRFGLVDAFGRESEATHPRLRHLGPEPLQSGFTAAWLFAQTRTVRQPVKAWLMDARRLVGVGNIYACEALFRAGVDPRRPAGSLCRAECQRIVKHTRGVLRDALRLGGTTIRTFQDARGQSGWFRLDLAVYGREGQACRCCQQDIEGTRIGGRSSFFCPRCQR